MNNFKNESGYNKSNKQADLLEKPTPVPLGVKPTLPDIYLPDPKDMNFDKVLNSGQVSLHADSNVTADSPVYGMTGPSPSYSISPPHGEASSGVDIDSNSNSNQLNIEQNTAIRTSFEKEQLEPKESSRSRSPSNEKIRTCGLNPYPKRCYFSF